MITAFPTSLIFSKLKSLILVTIGQIVKKWQQFLKSKMAAAAILNYDYLDLLTSPMSPASPKSNWQNAY